MDFKAVVSALAISRPAIRVLGGRTVNDDPDPDFIGTVLVGMAIGGILILLLFAPFSVH